MIRNKDNHVIFNVLQVLWKGKGLLIKDLKDKNVWVVKNADKMLDKWREYFQELLKYIGDEDAVRALVMEHDQEKKY